MLRILLGLDTQPPRPKFEQTDESRRDHDAGPYILTGECRRLVLEKWREEDVSKIRPSGS